MINLLCGGNYLLAIAFFQVGDLRTTNHQYARLVQVEHMGWCPETSVYATCIWQPGLSQLVPTIPPMRLHQHKKKVKTY